MQLDQSEDVAKDFNWLFRHFEDNYGIGKGFSRNMGIILDTDFDLG
jgi:hypothetical protein